MPRVKVASVNVAQTKDEAEARIERIGQLQRQITKIETTMNEKLSRIRTEHETQAAPLNTEIEQLVAEVQPWCEANRAELCKGKKKTAALTSGEVSWRIAPPKVVVRGVEAVIKALKKHDLARFVRTKEEINKPAILAEPQAVEGIAGISITQTEEFVIKPHQTGIERALAVK